MPYTLWSHNRLIGHTALDYLHVQEHLRHGFIEPTPVGEQPLLDATGVFRLCTRRWRGGRRLDIDDAYLEEFMRASAVREALDLELRDEGGTVIECFDIRIYPTEDLSEDMNDVEDDFEHILQDCAESLDLEVDEDFDLLAELEEAGGWSSTPSWEPDDERWTTMPYFVQVTLSGPGDTREPWRAQSDDATGFPT